METKGLGEPGPFLDVKSQLERIDSTEPSGGTGEAFHG